MSTLILNGSLNKTGDTESLLKIARENLIGDVIEINPYFDGLFPCIGCKICNKNGSCHLKDKLTPLLDLETNLINEINNVIVASPVRISGLTGSMMSMAERFQLWYVREHLLKLEPKINIKHGGIILVGGGHGSELRAISQAKHILENLRANILQQDIITSLKTDILPASEDEIAKENVRRLVLEMNQNKTRVT